jgi:hypothetical protein
MIGQNKTSHKKVMTVSNLAFLLGEMSLVHTGVDCSVHVLMLIHTEIK